MTAPVQSPIKGQPMRASWGAAVSSAVNSLLPMGAPGLLARQGVAGSGFAALPENKRERRAADAVLPWSFSCTEEDDPENPGETRRTGGWDNCRLQVGLDCRFYGSWKRPESENRIKGTHRTDDGRYYVRVNLSDGADPVAEIVTDSEYNPDNPIFDYERGIVVIYIGDVLDGKLDERNAIHMNPTVWKYL